MTSDGRCVNSWQVNKEKIVKYFSFVANIVCRDLDVMVT